MSIRFQYASEILAQFPQINGGILLASGLHNGDTPQPLREAYLAEQTATAARIGATPLSEIPALAAWRAAFRKFGVDPTQYRSASEALLRRVTKKGDIPFISTLVDLGNLVSIRYAIPVAVVDVRQIQGAITVRFADGTEAFTDHGQSQTIHPEPGEVVFVDQASRVAARRWCWRQSLESTAQPDTTDVLITIEAQHENGRTDVENAIADLTTLLRTYAGAQEVKADVLNANNPAMFD
jgi:DNA/RNA-binding domain of Phe-tRNA-synthetase-like protein